MWPCLVYRLHGEHPPTPVRRGAAACVCGVREMDVLVRALHRVTEQTRTVLGYKGETPWQTEVAVSDGRDSLVFCHVRHLQVPLLKVCRVDNRSVAATNACPDICSPL